MTERSINIKQGNYIGNIGGNLIQQSTTVQQAAINPGQNSSNGDNYGLSAYAGNSLVITEDKGCTTEDEVVLVDFKDCWFIIPHVKFTAWGRWVRKNKKTDPSNVPEYAIPVDHPSDVIIKAYEIFED